MPDFNSHISQATSNLKFLEAINDHCNTYWDWQVTVAFYTAVHLCNAHLYKATNSHYFTHNEVENRLSPYNPASISKIDEQAFLSFKSLRNLSRRSRYLFDSKSKGDASKTYDKHFAKAARHLNIIIQYFDIRYNLKVTPIKISCTELHPNEQLNFIQV